VRADTFEFEAWPPFAFAQVTTTHVYGNGGSNDKHVTVFAR